MASFNWPINPTTIEAGAIQFERDGVETPVSENTADPTQSTPLPVKTLGADGQPVDFATEATLSALNDKVTAVDTGNVTVVSSALPDGAATEATLSSIDGKVLTDTQLRASPVPVSGPLTDTELRATPVPVSGPLTDTELRATPVPVSGPITDTELRANPVAVSGPLTDTELRATPVPISGALTDTELRATPVPVDIGATLPLPTGAATEAKQDTGNTSLSNIDGKLPDLLNGRVPVDGSGVVQPVRPADDSGVDFSLNGVGQTAEIDSLAGRETWIIYVSSVGDGGQLMCFGSPDPGGTALQSVPAVNLTTGETSITISDIGLYRVNISGFSKVRLEVTALTSGNIEGIHLVSYAAGAISLNSPLPKGTNVIGSVNIASALVPTTFDHIDLTYVPTGDGEGEIQTVTYKEGGSGGQTVATLTLEYNSDNKLSSVTRT